MYRLYAVLVVGLLGVTAIDRASEFPGPDGAAPMEAK